MHIYLIAVGKIKEEYLSKGIQEYLKRLQPFARVGVKDVADERLPERPVPLLEEAVLDKEGDRLLLQVPQGAYVVALSPGGKMLSSEGLAGKLDELALTGKSEVAFLTGGTLGLSAKVLERADLVLSLSPMTFPHQMVRLLILEQLYRAFKISRGEPYHR